MLTMKGKYGLKALINLAGQAEGELAQSGEIAEAEGMSKKFLDTILGDLRNAGFVATKKGRHGGYMLARPPGEVMVGHVLRVLEGPLAPIPCASRTAYVRCQDCRDEETCAVRLTMLEVREAIVSVLDRKSLADLRIMGGAEAVEARLRTAG
ncbi:RrF2 family transcriptional regulator [Paenirhodobacter sp.]|uniref:RrF2 family transcriptional regulator n=1 Tax=Paenirhodobacter sp. TaxID=1965326 RepID=UPI003B3E2BA8